MYFIYNIILLYTILCSILYTVLPSYIILYTILYYNHMVPTFHSVYDYFALLKAFNTTLNFHQNFKDKLSSHQPSHIHTRHRTNCNFNSSLFNHSKTKKYYFYQVIQIWNSLPSSLKNCTSKFAFKKQIRSHFLASLSYHIAIFLIIKSNSFKLII